MSVQGIVVSENILTLYLHTLMNQRNLVKESHLMIKHLMMLSSGNYEKIGDHYEKQKLIGIILAVLFLLLLYYTSPLINNNFDGALGYMMKSVQRILFSLSSLLYL